MFDISSDPFKENSNRYLFNLLTENFRESINLNQNEKQAVLKQVRMSNMQSYFANNYNHYKPNFHAQMESHDSFNSEKVFLAARNLRIITEGLNISSEFQSKRIEHVFLKGFSLLPEFYENISDRTLKDIDILVAEENINHAVDSLISLGFKFKNNKDYKVIYLSKDHYDIPNLINEDGVIVELHYKILPNIEKTSCELTKSIFKTKTKAVLFGSNIFIPSINDNFMHLLYHGTSKELFSAGLYFISDLNKLSKHDSFNSSIIYEKAKKYSLLKEMHFYNDFSSRFKSKADDKINITTPSYILNLATILIFNNIGVNRKTLSTIGGLGNQMTIINNLKHGVNLIFPKKEYLEREFGNKVKNFTYLFYLIRRWTRQIGTLYRPFQYARRHDFIGNQESYDNLTKYFFNENNSKDK